MKDTEQATLWEFTTQSTKDAVKLYFQPVRRVMSWFADEPSLTERQDAFDARLRSLEERTNPKFDSLGDLQLRFSRLLAYSEDRLCDRINEIKTLLGSAQELAEASEPGAKSSLNDVLLELRRKVRRLEIDLGFEKHLHPPRAKRTTGASGD